MMFDALRQLLALTLISSAVIAFVLLIRRPVRRAFGASVSYRVWLLVPISMVAMLLPGVPHAGYALVVDAQVGEVYSLVERSLTAPLEAQATADSSAWFFGAWATGAFVFLAYFAGLQRAFVKGLGKLSELQGTWRAESSVGCPALLGVLSPRVVLPRDFESRYTPQEQALVLAHERVHLQRRDTLWNALLVLLRCVFWFNPLVHIAASLVRVDQELACDAAVIDRHPASRRTYADAMLKTELAEATLPVGCHWRSDHPFKERLEMLKTRLPSRARRTLGSGLFAAVSVVVGYAVWAAEPPPVPAPATSAVTAVLAPRARGLLRFGPETQVETSASIVSSGPNGAQILEGDVQIEITPPAGRLRPMHLEIGGPTGGPGPVLIRKTLDAATRPEGTQARRGLTVRTDKATLTPTPEGGVVIEFDGGTIDQHDPQ